ncbi:type II toxin-antitoxin system Phd/YefM family antitoxin [Pannonibacter indicus]|jgi:antitoxin Phd|uniref:Antitoxin n=1 Tax=Pannonibacter indicus TaxID=466044 RepID=A0A0K6HVE3_9HYPH|nr:type II toxin-antitoxin system Phd/YefM family antitoxin [Pannonibacter indicus]CUA94743.1 prevent-host-death family protein [Pannonibacter indicus]
MEINIRTFSATELANKTGDVFAAAAQELVAIQRHGKPRFVMLSAEEYERLTSPHGTRRAVHVSALTDSEASDLLTALADSMKDD